MGIRLLENGDFMKLFRHVFAACLTLSALKLMTEYWREFGSQEYLWSSCGDFHLLFSALRINSCWSLSFTCVFLFFLSAALEISKRFRNRQEKELLRRFSHRQQSTIPTNRRHVLLAFTYAVQTFVSFSLMLVFMTFNISFISSILLGQFAVYFLRPTYADQLYRSPFPRLKRKTSHF